MATKKTKKAAPKKAAPKKATKKAAPKAEEVKKAAPAPETQAAEAPKKTKKSISIKDVAAVKVDIPELGQVNWQTIHEKYKSEKALTYNMAKSFPPHKAIKHPAFGWGFVLSNQNDRLSVIFESGIKKLISNYK